jgi:diguanylate cyclase (GGDEF)-like protein
MAYIINKPENPTISAPRQATPAVSDLDYVSVSPLNLEALRRMRILIVDDTPDNIDLVKAMLEKSGFTNTVSAPSGPEALECMRDSIKDGVSDIDIVLLDVMMPKMDGYEVCRVLRSHSEWADIPTIMITANAAWKDDIARASFDAGATDIMFKPIRRSELIPRVISALSLKRERDLRKRREQELETELAERKVMEARLQYLVAHDDLTGLSNRRRLEQALDHAIHEAQENHHSSALFYIDLDQFKVVNDLEGHVVGDRLLVSIANRLRREIGTKDLLARISSDEYAILIEQIEEQSAFEKAQSLRKLLDDFHYHVDDREYHIGASIGVALIRADEPVTTSEVLARADQACYVAKTHGRNMVHMYSQEDTEMHTLRSAVYWVPLIRDALANNKFKLFFQPVLSLNSNEVTHYEALIRMVGEKGEFVTPDNFIPVAERMGLIHDIDLWVVGHAIDVLKNLPADKSHISLNINLSSYAFQDPELLPLVRDKLATTGVAAERLTFEITETAAVANFAQTREMVRQLRALGCRFALDDFGAGFNSFNYVKQFPVDYLKIDGTFITNLVNDVIDQTLVKSMVEIARTMQKQIIAEFVESKEILELLRQYGVDYAQGYYIGVPGKTIGGEIPAV